MKTSSDILNILEIMNKVADGFYYSINDKLIKYKKYLYDPIAGNLYFENTSKIYSLEYHPNYRDVAQEILLHCYEDDKLEQISEHGYQLYLYEQYSKGILSDEDKESLAKLEGYDCFAEFEDARNQPDMELKSQEVIDYGEFNLADAYSEIYRCASYIINYIASAIVDKNITIINQDGHGEFNIEIAKHVAALSYNMLPNTKILELDYESHIKYINDLQSLFANIYPQIKDIETHYYTFSDELAYKHIATITAYLLKKFLQSAQLGYTTIFIYSKYNGQKLISPETISRLIRELTNFISTIHIQKVTDFNSHDKVLNFFKKIVQEIGFAPKGHTDFIGVENDKRYESLMEEEDIEHA